MVTIALDLIKSVEELKRLLDQADEVLFTKDNLPLVKIPPTQFENAPKPRVAGLGKGSILYISEDFDDPLPDEFWFGDDETAP